MRFKRTVRADADGAFILSDGQRYRIVWFDRVKTVPAVGDTVYCQKIEVPIVVTDRRRLGLYKADWNPKRPFGSLGYADYVLDQAP